MFTLTVPRGRLRPATLFMEHPHWPGGRIYLPRDLESRLDTRSFPGRPARRQGLKEEGIVVSILRRPRRELCDHAWDQPHTKHCRIDTVWHDIAHNARVNSGGAMVATRLFGAGSGNPVSSVAGVFTVIAIAKGTPSLAATDLSIGSASQSVTTNEQTGNGLDRVGGVVGTYSAQSGNDTLFTQPISKIMTLSGTPASQCYGSAILDSATVAGSWMAYEAAYTSAVSPITADTLETDWSIGQ